MIASLTEFAYAIRQTPAVAAEHQLLLELAEGLVVDQLGELTEYPTKAKAVVLAAAGRAFFARLAVLQGKSLDRPQDQVLNLSAADMGVYLTDEECGQLGGAGSAPQYCFPEPPCYPDPADRPYWAVTSW